MSSENKRQIVLDSRLPIGENMSTNDATHPLNIVVLAANTEAQGGADQRYDINPPPRVEGFISNFTHLTPFRRLPFLVNIFIMCLLFVAVLQIKQRVIKIILAVCIIFVLHSVIDTFENRSSSTHH
jgi:hypothetical protein